jgi:putative flippase GtrA
VSTRFAKFLAVGAIATSVDFALFYYFFNALQLHIVLANLLSYSAGMIVGFFLNRAWTFSDSESRSKKRIIFSLLFGYLGLMLNTSIVALSAHFMDEMLAKCVGVFVIIFFNYITQKRFVFRL